MVTKELMYSHTESSAYIYITDMVDRSYIHNTE